MSIKYLLFSFLFLAGAASAQEVWLGPLITPDKCIPDKVNNYTVMCHATDGVHVSLGGQPFGGALCDSTNPACKGPKGDQGVPGKDSQVPGPQGIQGVPGLVIGTNGTIDIACPGGKGTIQAGWVTKTCTFTITAVH